MKKVLKLIGKWILILLGIALVILLLMTLYNTFITVRENKLTKNVGQTITIDGKNMRVNVQGDGEHTIVLLSGLGTYSPIEDFAPLSSQLSETYRVVTLEYLGYGLSDDTKKARTTKNIVQEIHAALSKLQIAPPYVLTAHSLSGVYALGYIQEYPDEVEALIGIDPSVPEQINYEEEMNIPEWLYYPSRVFDFTGISRMELKDDGLLAEMSESGTYTAEELKIIKAVKSRRSASMALIHENNTIRENLNTLSGIKYPKDMPVLTFLADDTIEQADEMFAEKGYNVSWLGLHESLITNASIQKTEVLSGSHYLHWTNADKMAAMIKDFLK